MIKGSFMCRVILLKDDKSVYIAKIVIDVSEMKLNQISSTTFVTKSKSKSKTT